jgi:hypothetical protein
LTARQSQRSNPMTTQNTQNQSAADKSAHTPGPWKLLHEAAGKLKLAASKQKAVVVGPAGNTVADCETTTSNPISEALANARLIAVAPELLSELKEVCEYLEWLAENRLKDSALKDEALTTAESGRAAIAKAEGK